MPARRLVLVVAVVASLASCRGGCARNASETKEAASDRRLALVPADARMVAFIDVGKLRDAPILANFARAESTNPTVARGLAAVKSELGKYAEKTGFHPLRDVDTVMVAAAIRSPSGIGFIVRGRHMDEARLVAQLRKGEAHDALVETRRGARRLWSWSGQADKSAVFLDDKTLLLGSDHWAEWMADLADGVGSARSAASNAELARLLGTVSGHAIYGAALDPDGPHVGGADGGSAPLVRHATWTVDAGQRITVAVHAELASAEAAAALLKDWHTALVAPEVASMFRVRTDGATVHLDGDLDEAGLAKVALLGAMVAAVPFIHMD